MGFQFPRQNQNSSASEMIRIYKQFKFCHEFYLIGFQFPRQDQNSSVSEMIRIYKRFELLHEWKPSIDKKYLYCLGNLAKQNQFITSLDPKSKVCHDCLNN